MLANIKKSKRRRYIRHAIELEALLVCEKSISVPCKILDFCSSGFFLGFKPADLEISLGKHVKILFSLNQEHHRERFEIDAKVAHFTPTSMGVSVENMPVSTLNGLKNEANIHAETPYLDQPIAKSNKLSHRRFKNAFKQILLETLPALPVGFFESMAEGLEIANEHSECFTNRSALDDLLTTLKLNREALISEFCSSAISQVDYISEPSHKNQVAINTDDLSLVEKDEFEDWLNMSSISRKLNNHFEEQIKQLTRELYRVLGYSTGAINNPISPTVLCDCFREIILQLELGKNINGILYNIFGKVLLNNMGALYEQTLIFLSKNESAPLYAHQPAHERQPIETGLGRSHTENENPAPRRSGRLSVSAVDEQRQQSVGQIAGILLNILKEVNEDYPKTSELGLSVEKQHSLPYFDSDEVVSAISKIQHSIGGDNPLHFDSGALQKRLQDVLASSGTGSKSLSGKDIQQLEVYGKFFETLFTDLGVSPDMKSYMENIHLPLLSLPLQGDDFLNSESNPVRNILNQIAVLDSAVQDNRVIKNINVKNTLEKIVARIAQEANTNPGVFKEAERELAGVTKEIIKSADANIKRIVEAYEGQQKLEIARRSVQQEIDKRIAGRTMPTIIPRLLQSGWQYLLTIAELNDESQDDKKLKYLKVLDELIFWLYEQESFLKMQSGSIQTTLNFVSDNLGSVCSDVFLRDSIIDELTALLLGVGVPRVRKTMATVRIPPATAEGNASEQLIDDDRMAEVEQLSVGEWMTILQGSQGYESMKLIWIGEVLKVYVFVNRDGLNKLELSKLELAESLRSGAAIKIENLDLPLMDRTTNLMLQKMHEKLIYNATHDAVTGLYTKDEFIKQLKHEMSKSGDAEHILCHMEFLDFRVITNVCGDAGGAQLLKMLAQLVTNQLKEHDLLARLGDKSFAILFKHCSVHDGYEISKKLVKLISESHFQWQEKSFAIVVSMGLVAFGGDSYDVHQLLQRADSASISAERTGQNQVLMFTDDDENLKRQNDIYDWIGHIDSVFSHNELFVRCQMIVAIDPDDKRHRHYEILLGVKDEAGNVIPPDQFIPAVERCKRMPEIDRWIITNVFDWIDNNKHFFDSMDGFSINLSGQSINSDEFLEFLTELLASGNVPPDKLTFEITETVAAENLVFMKRFIKAVKQFGCKFSLDDFGSGYSSYSYLKNLNVDYLKIDGAFVKDIANSKADVAIVKSMNEIAHSLGLKTIAEYVENNEIREILRQIGVDYAQGFGVQKPIPLIDLVIDPPSAAMSFSFEDTEFWGF